MSIQQYLDSVTNPQVALPMVGTAGAANMFIDHLPVLINCGMAIYVVLLISHKAWAFYTEYKEKRGLKK